MAPTGFGTLLAGARQQALDAIFINFWQLPPIDQQLASAPGHDPLKKVSGPSGFRSRAGRPKQQG